MKYLTNDRNIARTADIAVSAVMASQTVYRTDTADKVGGGAVTLSGSYTGESDATFDVEVADDAGTAPVVSEPAFTGVGNGTMTGLSADVGVASQQVVVTLEDLGTETTHAYAPFQSVTLQAKAAGPGGNDITVTVDASALVSTVTKFALRDQIRAEQNEYIGDHWNFGASTLNVDGTIPAGALRLRFGDDPQVYRQYRRYVSGRYVYGFSPAPVRDVAAGSPVYTVTGERTVTISDGVTTEVATGITTLYDLLSWIRANSSLVAVDGVVQVDRKPSGQSVTDLSVYTQPYVASTIREGTNFIRRAAIGLTADATAPTETLQIICADPTLPGGERWDVIGDVSGALRSAYTAETYANGPYRFTIPAIPLPPPRLRSSGSAKLEPESSRDPAPQMCVTSLIPGAQARSKTYTFVWQTRSADCGCEDMPLEGQPDDWILGVETDDGEPMSAIPAALQTRLQTLYDWRSGFVTANTALLAGTTVVDDNGASTPGDLTTVTSGKYPQEADTAGGSHRYERVSAVLKADRVDIDASKQAVAIFHGALAQIYNELEDVPAAAATEWDAAMTDLATDFGVIDGNVGSEFWRKYSAMVEGTTEWSYAGLIQLGTTFLTQEFDIYLERYRARMDKVLVLAGIEPDFDNATREGNSVWRDHGGSAWFVSQDGLLPLQPGHYYHSARMERNAAGRERPVSTQEFGIGITVGCGLVAGDKLYITIDAAGSVQPAYQQGDIITAQITRAVPLVLGGGQTGDDTLRFSVIGSAAGDLGPYDLTMDEFPYSSGGIEFTISRGGIGFALGDRFVFSVEAARFRYRRDGGEWSSAANIAPTVALSDGLTATFTPSTAPNWVPGDRWTFAAEAINGPDKMRRPTAGAYRWDSATVIEISAGDTVGGIALLDHTIQAGATITIEGSDNGFATTPLNEAITWRAGNIWHPVDAAFAEYRITINGGGSIGWLYIGDPLQMQVRTGAVEMGKIVKRQRLPSPVTRSGLGVQVEHEALTQASVDALIAALEHACEYDERRIGIVPNDAEAVAATVIYGAGTLEIDDELGFGPRDTANRLQSVTLELEAAP